MPCSFFEQLCVGAEIGRLEEDVQVMLRLQWQVREGALVIAVEPHELLALVEVVGVGEAGH
ncbi:hypothetical protein ASE19_06940 [Nocardioides sp. Root79]|nr:hypothetical protein ASE19_06940 [Nocardioides sp. Root79]KRC71154.1 hypothetical protein ASE20_09350 [Nocardioides sp. Root240]